MDVGARVEIYELIDAVVSQGGAVLMASSDLPEVLGMSDRILVMSNGRLSGQMPADQATQEKIMALAVSHMDGEEKNEADGHDDKMNSQERQEPTC